MKPLEGKAALITGASQGIGRAICLRLAEAGANIGGMDVACELLEETGSLVRQQAAEFLPLRANVAKLEEVTRGVEELCRKFERLDVLVNNAGITRDNLMIRMSEQEWNDVLAVNLTGVFNGLKAASRVMMRQRGGSIVNIASVVGIVGNAGQANYSASKAGVIGLTKTAARELAKRNVRVNAVAPGYIMTRMTEQLSEEATESLKSQIPLARLGSPEDVAEAVLFLASAASDYITGQVIRVDGGMVMQ